MNTTVMKFHPKFCILSLLLSANGLIAQIVPSATDVLPVYKLESSLQVDGKLDDPSWEKAPAYQFNSFFRSEKPEDEQETLFKMLWDDSTLYFAFEASDHFLTSQEKTRDNATYEDDCAEVFLIPAQEKIGLHFGFEVNLLEVANDFVFLNKFYNDYRVVVKGYNPVYQAKAKLYGTLNNNSDQDQGYTMELAIPLEAFRTVSEFEEVKGGTKWGILAVRQDRNELAVGKRFTSTLFPLKEFDVHDPQYFGTIEFVEK